MSDKTYEFVTKMCIHIYDLFIILFVFSYLYQNHFCQLQKCNFALYKNSEMLYFVDQAVKKALVNF